MKEQMEPNFEQLIMPRREVQNLTETRYRVYSDHSNWELVEASSALEALQRSSIKKAHRIEKYDPLGDNVLQIGEVQKLLGAGVPAAAQAVEAPHEEVLIPVEEKPLSDDDVNKLLNNN